MGQLTLSYQLHISSFFDMVLCSVLSRQIRACCLCLQSSTPETPRANSTGAQTPIKKPYGDVTFTSVLEGPATPPREHQRHVASACCASLAASSKNSNTRQAKTKKKISALKRALLLSAIAAVAAMAGQKARRCDKKQKS